MHPNPRKFAMVGGIIMLLMGVLSLIPAFEGSEASLPLLRLESSYGAFLGLFPMNIVNKIALIAFGVWGIAAARTANMSDLRQSIFFSKSVFVVMGLLAILGLFSATNTLDGYWPLFGGEVFAHGVFAVIGAYYGFANKAQAMADRRHEERAA